MKKNVLLLCGGGGTEHDISLVSSKYIKSILLKLEIYNVITVEIGKDKKFRKLNSDNLKEEVEINFKGQLIGTNKEDIHFAIPCIHGPPGETGEIQTFLEMVNIPYLGCGPEASTLCFNKVSSKLWFSAIGIPNTPFVFISSLDDYIVAENFFNTYGKVFVKASSQGSSVGCYQVFNIKDLKEKITEAFKFSEFILIEKMINARELEISVYENNGKIHATFPGEIICPTKFYSFEEKYNPESKTTTELLAKRIDESSVLKMKEYALQAFKYLKLRHLSRIDFFYTDEGEIFLNEINTFPGMTPISMFPKMMEQDGLQFKNFIEEIIAKNIK